MSDFYEACANRGGICDCNGRPCATDIKDKFAKAEQDWMVGAIDRVGDAMGWTDAEVQHYRVEGIPPLSVINQAVRPGPLHKQAASGFLAGVEISAAQQAQIDALTAIQLPAVAKMSEPAPTPMPSIGKTESEVPDLMGALKDSLDAVREAHGEPKVKTDSTWADVQPKDEVAIEWDGQDGTLGGWRGLVLEIIPPGDEEKPEGWIYLKGAEKENGDNYMRAPLTGIRLRAHLVRWDNGMGYTQGSGDVAEIRKQRGHR